MTASRSISPTIVTSEEDATGETEKTAWRPQGGQGSKKRSRFCRPDPKIPALFIQTSQGLPLERSLLLPPNDSGALPWNAL